MTEFYVNGRTYTDRHEAVREARALGLDRIPARYPDGRVWTYVLPRLQHEVQVLRTSKWA